MALASFLPGVAGLIRTFVRVLVFDAFGLLMFGLLVFGVLVFELLVIRRFRWS